MSKIFSIKPLLLIIIALFLFSLNLLSPINQAFALQEAREGLETSAKGGFGDEVTNEADVSEIIGNVIGTILSFVGVLFLLLIIYAGFTWMLARGNEAEAKKAKDLMFDAVVGLVIIMAAYAITKFIGERLT